MQHSAHVRCLYGNLLLHSLLQTASYVRVVERTPNPAKKGPTKRFSLYSNASFCNEVYALLLRGTILQMDCCKPFVPSLGHSVYWHSEWEAKGKCPNAAIWASSGIFLRHSYILKCFHLTCFRSDYRLTDWWCWWCVLARFLLPTSCSRLWFIVAFVPLIRVPGSDRPSWLAWPQSKYSTDTFFFVSIKRLYFTNVSFWIFM